MNTAGVQGAITYLGTQVLTNPQFCNPASCNLAATVAGDYTLGSGSPCLPGGNACVAAIGALPEGCISVDVAEFGGELASAGLSAPSVIRGAGEIAWSLPRAGRARLAIHDAAGRQVALLLDEPTARASAHRTPWSGSDDHGQRLSRGVYFVRFRARRLRSRES